MTTGAPDMVGREVQRLIIIFERFSGLISNIDQPIQMLPGKTRRAVLIGEILKKRKEDGNEAEWYTLAFTREGIELWRKWKNDSGTYHEVKKVGNPLRCFVSAGGKSHMAEIRLLEITRGKINRTSETLMSLAQAHVWLTNEIGDRLERTIAVADEMARLAGQAKNQTQALTPRQ